jgi:hypothetical protein
MAKDVFRFSVVRPFQKRDIRNTRNKLIFSYSPQYNSDFYNDLKAAKILDDWEKMIKRAQEYRKNHPDFVKDLSALKMPLLDLDAWIVGGGDKIGLERLTFQVKQSFSRSSINNWKNWVKGPEFKTEVGKLSDSLIACTIGASLDKHAQVLRPTLVRMIKIAKLLERIATDDKSLKARDGIATAMNAIVLMPEDVFPIPLKDAEREKILDSYKIKKAEIKQRRDDQHLRQLGR